MLEKTRVWSHSDRVRLLVFFSITLEEYRKGKLGPEGLGSKERTDSYCQMRGFLRSQVNSGVGILSSSMRPPTYHLAFPSSLMA